MFYSLLRCGWLWMGDHLSLLWDDLCLFYPWVGSQQQHQHFFAGSIIWWTQTPSLKIHTGLKLEWVVELKLVGNFLFHLMFSLVAHLMSSWELLMQTCWWLLSDHWSMHHTSPHSPGSCGMEIWKLIEAIRAREICHHKKMTGCTVPPQRKYGPFKWSLAVEYSLHHYYLRGAINTIWDE